jgi:hypothetical protein
LRDGIDSVARGLKAAVSTLKQRPHFGRSQRITKRLEMVSLRASRE